MNSNKNGKIIITICREYGSGGRQIGEEVAKRLDIPYYNRNLIDMVAKESGFASGYIDKFEEHVSSPLIWGIPMPRAIWRLPVSQCKITIQMRRKCSKLRVKSLGILRKKVHVLLLEDARIIF